jgi:hypothetical protein
MRPNSLITCPHCGFQSLEAMPLDECTYFYNCGCCHQLLTPKRGDCCVFCSYGDTPCPPVQRAGDSAGAGATAGCCR